MSITVPAVAFSDERLPNGLRLIVAEDHLAPVVAINVWYGVGSKHEQPGKTGFAHLFEHVMFQGSRNVAKAEHIALVQAAGGTMNGTTWLDRTNYFETLPSHQLDLGLWLEADRMATLLDALSQENLDNQREVVKNEKRWSYDNRPYGSWQEKLQGHLFPRGAPVPPPDDRVDGGPRCRLARGRPGVLPDLLRAEQRRPVGGRRRRHRPPSAPAWSATSERSRPTRPSRRWATCRCRRRSAGSGARPSTTGSRCRASTSGFRAPVFGDPRLDALDVAGQILAGGKGSRLHRRLVRDERIAQDVALFTLGFIGGASICAGWATVRPGVPVDRVEAALHEELERLATEPVTDDELARAFALVEADELGALQRVEERADRLSMYATLFDDPDLINRMLPRYLSVTPAAIREVAAATFRPDNRLVLTYLPRGRRPRTAGPSMRTPLIDVDAGDEEVAA